MFLFGENFFFKIFFLFFFGVKLFVVTSFKLGFVGTFWEVNIPFFPGFKVKNGL